MYSWPSAVGGQHGVARAEPQHAGEVTGLAAVERDPAAVDALRRDREAAHGAPAWSSPRRTETRARDEPADRRARRRRRGPRRRGCRRARRRPARQPARGGTGRRVVDARRPAGWRPRAERAPRRIAPRRPSMHRHAVGHVVEGDVGPGRRPRPGRRRPPARRATPSRAAAIARMPEPVPRSIIRDGPSARSPLRAPRGSRGCCRDGPCRTPAPDRS